MGLKSDVFFCLHVGGLITGGGLISGWAYKWQFIVCCIHGVF